MCHCHVFQLGKYDNPTCKCYAGYRLCTVFMCIYVCTADISLDTLQHHARRKATYGMEKDNNQYKCNSHNSRTPALFLPDKTAICHTHTGKRHRKYACTSQHDSNWHADGRFTDPRQPEKRKTIHFLCHQARHLACCFTAYNVCKSCICPYSRRKNFTPHSIPCLHHTIRFNNHPDGSGI